MEPFMEESERERSIKIADALTMIAVQMRRITDLLELPYRPIEELKMT